MEVKICQHCRAKKSRMHVWGPGQQVAAMLWGESKFEVRKVKE